MDKDRVGWSQMLLAGRRYSRRATLRASVAGLTAAALGAAAHRGTQAQTATPEVASSVPDSGDFSGLVDIGGRKLYLESHGAGSPTVVLVAGGRSSAIDSAVRIATDGKPVAADGYSGGQ